MGVALGLGALLGGIGLLAAGGRRREESGDSGDLDRELDSLGLQREPGSSPPQLVQDQGGGIYRPVVETTAEEVRERR